MLNAYRVWLHFSIGGWDMNVPFTSYYDEVAGTISVQKAGMFLIGLYVGI